MRFRVVATDYDGTIAHYGRVDPALVRLIEAVRASGRRVILVTGRHLPDLRTVFPRLAVFDLVVAENGALLYWPATAEEKLLSEPIPAEFIRELQYQRVRPLSLGRGIVATLRSEERAVLETIQDLGLDLRAIPNKESVMVLHRGTDKGTGLKAALQELNMSAQSVVGLGDAENDHDFLRLCGCSVAVANALDSVKQNVDIVTEGEEGAGAAEILESLLADDLASYKQAAVKAGGR